MKAREPRKHVTTPARMRTDAGWSDVTIRDVSSRGIGLRCSRAPRRGDYIELCRHRHKLIGRVMWSEGESFGVLLSDAIVVDELLSSRAPASRCRDERPGGSRPAGARQGGALRVEVVNLAQNSRHAARLMNFTAVAAIACLGALLTAYLASSVLSDALSAVSSGLATKGMEVPAG